MENLQNKVAVVTGGGSGINLAFCKLLHNAGCKVLIADIALHSQAKEWFALVQPEKSSEAQVDYVQTDVTDWAQLENIFDFAKERFGAVPDIVVPGAGVYEPSSNTFWADQDSESRYKHCMPAIQHRDASLHLYTAAKHGVTSFIRGMAPLQEMAGIRVVGVAPGTIGTPLFTDHPEASKFLDLEKDVLLSPECVANAMFALLTTSEHPAGTVLEVCDETKWRVVTLLNNPGPQGPASLTSRKNEAINDIMRYLSVEWEAGSTSGLKIATD